MIIINLNCNRANRTTTDLADFSFTLPENYKCKKIKIRNVVSQITEASLSATLNAPLFATIGGITKQSSFYKGSNQYTKTICLGLSNSSNDLDLVLSDTPQELETGTPITITIKELVVVGAGDPLVFTSSLTPIPDLSYEGTSDCINIQLELELNEEEDTTING